MPLRTFVIHGRKTNYHHLQEFGRSSIKTSVKEVTIDVVDVARERETEP